MMPNVIRNGALAWEPAPTADPTEVVDGIADTFDVDVKPDKKPEVTKTVKSRRGR